MAKAGSFEADATWPYLANSFAGTSGEVRQFHQQSLKGFDAMPDTRHEIEADKILAALSVATPDEQALSQGRRLLAEALERAERRGRQISGSQKESSG
jgi:hypothetical protein